MTLITFYIIFLATQEIVFTRRGGNPITSIVAMSRSCLYLKCPTCSNYIDPICASNRITYPNQCWISCYNNIMGCEPKIEIEHRGWCPMTIRPRHRAPSRRTTKTPSSTTEAGRTCNVSACICRSTFNPMCGSDGVTYANGCYYRCARRCFGDLEFIKCGLCSGTDPPNRRCLGRK